MKFKKQANVAFFSKYVREDGKFTITFSQKLLTYTHVYSIIIDRKEVKTLSKKKQKKSGNKKDQPASTINLITAIVNLVIAILLLIEKLTR